MVDTIVIRVHNLKKHDELVKYVNKNFNGTERVSAKIPKAEMDELKKPTVDEKYLIDYFRATRTGTHLIRYRKQKRVNNSGNYYFQAFENRDRDFMEFNFSIPKYIYGTNIFQFVIHNWNKNFIYYKNRQLKYNLGSTYDQLIPFFVTRKQICSIFGN
jgi:hypothetical protein